MVKSDPYGNCISFKIDREIKKNKAGHRTQTIHFWMPDFSKSDLVKEKSRDMRITKRYKFKSNCHGLVDSKGDIDKPNEDTKHDVYVKAKYIAKSLAAAAGINPNRRRRRRTARPMRRAVLRMPAPPVIQN